MNVVGRVGERKKDGGASHLMFRWCKGEASC